MKKIIVTGSAGFIGFHLSQRLLMEGYEVIGIDNLNDYYDVNLKLARNNLLQASKNYLFHQIDLADKASVDEVFEITKPSYVIHLAAQAGVRYSLINPNAYVQANIVAFVNIIEASRQANIEHFLYASSSSVYGANTVVPFSTSHNVDHPVSLYAASKKANELMAHTYSVNFKLPTTGLRFFTVYGPYGRPDMALFLFTKAILEGRPIDVFNHGNMRRDFTYVDDVVESIVLLIPKKPQEDDRWDSDNPNPSSSFAPYKVYNIGNNSPVDLMHFIKAIESEIGEKAQINYLPIQKGDVPVTFADVTELQDLVSFKPSTSIETGVKAFVSWYREFYQL
ncbi:MAG: NAD-dependent epimerase [Cyclobacteriaceae bacterium]